MSARKVIIGAMGALVNISFHKLTNRFMTESGGGNPSLCPTAQYLLNTTISCTSGVDFKPIIVAFTFPCMDHVLLELHAEQILGLVAGSKVVLVLEQLILLIESLRL